LSRRLRGRHTGAALEYHRATNAPAGGTDEVAWVPGTRPHPFRDYGEADRLPLDVSVAGPLLQDGAGIVRSRQEPRWPKPIHFRGYSSAGALYPVEAYVAAPEGLLAFDALGAELVRVGDRDPRAALAEAAAVPELASAASVVVLSAIPARTGWKYGERGYRHVWWDAGTMLANLLALAASEGLGPHLYTAFVDRQVSALLGCDGVHEYPLALLTLGLDAKPADQAAQTTNGALPRSESSARYPRSERLHEASSLADAAAVRAWRVCSGGAEPSLERPELVRAIGRRGSVRDYGSEPIPLAPFAELLEWSEAPIPADAPRVLRQLVSAAAVDGLEPGIYDSALGLIRAHAEWELRERTGFAAMEQQHPRLAAANVFQLADVAAVANRLGDRGYRWAQLEAGIRAGRLQIGAFMRGWGAAASTFYDAEVSRLLGTHESPMLMVAVGRPPAR
jgi:SagB-type dehydrogenase family enzyme